VLRIDAAARVDGVVRVDAPAAEVGKARELRGASTWAPQLIALSRGLGLRSVQPALINGSVGVIVAPRGRLVRAMIFTVTNDKVTRLEAIGNPARLRELDIAIL
jgi:RNA polymerase sigma-70 factor (ECF subfamily)